jgi:integrase
MVVTDLHTGLRKRELLGLRWEQIDFTRGIIALGRRTKSGKGRDVPLNQAVYEVMRGGSIVKLQAILGHASVRTTQIYARLAPDHLIGATSILEGLGDARLVASGSAHTPLAPAVAVAGRPA